MQSNSSTRHREEHDIVHIVPMNNNS